MCQSCDLIISGSIEEPVRSWRHFLTRLSPPTRLLVLGACLVSNLVWSSVTSSLLLAAACLVLLLVDGVAPGVVAKRLIVPWYLAIVAVATQVFLVGNSPLFQVGPLVGHAEGLSRGALLGSRIFGGTAVVLAFSMTSTITELVSLASWLRVPPVLVEIASLTYRYLFLMAEEGQRIREAQTTRLGHSGWWKSMRSYGILIGMVVARSYDKAEAVYLAMAARGYRGSLPTESCRRPGTADARAAGLALTGLALIFWFGQSYGM